MEKNTAELTMTGQVKVEATKAEATKDEAAVGAETKAAEESKKPVQKEMRPEVILQYREYEANMEIVTERVKAHYIAKGNAEDSIESLQIYVKPEEFTAYYVINEGFCGKVNLF